MDFLVDWMDAHEFTNVVRSFIHVVIHSLMIFFICCVIWPSSSSLFKVAFYRDFPPGDVTWRRFYNIQDDRYFFCKWSTEFIWIILHFKSPWFGQKVPFQTGQSLARYSCRSLGFMLRCWESAKGISPRVFVGAMIPGCLQLGSSRLGGHGNTDRRGEMAMEPKVSCWKSMAKMVKIMWRNPSTIQKNTTHGHSPCASMLCFLVSLEPRLAVQVCVCLCVCVAPNLFFWTFRTGCL